MTEATRNECGQKSSEPDWTKLDAALYRYCLVVAGLKEKAEDLAQSVWVKAFPILKDKGHANPEAFLLRIAKNNWIDECRRDRNLQSKLKEMETGAASVDCSSLDIEPLLELLSGGMSRMQLAVFLLREVLDFSIAETAGMLDATDGAVKSALHRARGAVERIRHAPEPPWGQRRTNAAGCSQRNKQRNEGLAGGDRQDKEERNEQARDGNELANQEESADWLSRLAMACQEGDGAAIVWLIMGRNAGSQTIAHAVGFMGSRPACQAAYSTSGLTLAMAA